MPEYNETDVTGSAYQRCYQVVIDNPLSGVPTIRFDEERVVVATGAPSRTPLGPLAVAFDPAATIPLIDPQTGEPTGESITHRELYVALYSGYIEQAAARDALIDDNTAEADNAADD